MVLQKVVFRRWSDVGRRFVVGPVLLGLELLELVVELLLEFDGDEDSEVLEDWLSIHVVGWRNQKHRSTPVDHLEDDGMFDTPICDGSDVGGEIHELDPTKLHRVGRPTHLLGFDRVDIRHRPSPFTKISKNAAIIDYEKQKVKTIGPYRVVLLALK